jgi:phosphatidylglycerophosphatase A
VKTIAKLSATCLGIGYFPLAPGTVASFGMILLYKLWLYQWSWPVYLGMIIPFYALGVWSSSVYAAHIKKEDPRNVVIDEALGQYLALFTLAPTWTLVLLSFFLFRFFDILKPLFIKKAEKFHSGWGIMLDDIVAGIYASILINIYLLLKP